MTTPVPATNITPAVNPTSFDANAQSGPFGTAQSVWIQAGGNPQASAMAAAVADASSGLNPNASFTQSDGSVARGLWLINDTFGALSTTDPIANARAAIAISNNGTDWTSWCAAWSDNDCGNSGGTYLGDGSNALASLQQRLGPSSYNVAGAQVAGNGASAATTVAQASTGHTSLLPGLSTGSPYLKWAMIAAVVGLLAYLVVAERRRHRGA